MTTITTQKFIRKPFSIDAIRVTEGNFKAISEWCGGTIEVEKRGSKEIRFIRVDVKQAMSDRQTKAYVGDWLLSSKGKWKVYTHHAFETHFEPYEHQVVGQEQLFELERKFAKE